MLNIGPQPNGELPSTALLRLKEMGRWLEKYGESIYGTTAGDFQHVEWGASTRKGNLLYLHVTDAGVKSLDLPLKGKMKRVTCLNDGREVRYTKTKTGITVMTEGHETSEPDLIFKLEMK